MPSYDFQCDTCHRVVELQRKIAEHDRPEDCSRSAVKWLHNKDDARISACACAFDQVPLRGPDPACEDCHGTGEVCSGALQRVGIELTARMSNSWKP